MENIKEKFEFEVSPEYEGMRLDKYLAEQIEEATRSYLEKLIDNSYVKINSKVINKNGRKLKSGEKIEISIPEEENIDIEAENTPLDIVFENDDFILVNKKYNMVVHPAYGNYNGTLVNALLYYTNNLSSVNGNIRPGIIHRLDKDTSGLILVAKNNYAHAKLASMFTDKTIHKTYLCIVKGNFSDENLEGRIENLIGRDTKDRKKMAVVKENGKLAISNYRVVEQVKDYSLVEVLIETGRTHQIRVHMKSINHPILGDVIYGSEDKNVKRQMLHAFKLEFLNPLDNIYWDNSSEKYGVKTEIEKRNKLLQNILEKDDWIIEGIYYKWLEQSFKNADIIYILDLPKYIYKFHIIKRFVKRKLKLETGKKETLKSLLDLLKWTDKFQNEDMKEIIKILEKYKEKVYFIKDKKEIKEILKRKLF